MEFGSSREGGLYLIVALNIGDETEIIGRVDWELIYVFVI